MNQKEQVVQAVYGAIDEVNQLLAKELQLEKSPETVVVGRGGKLDSLGIVNLIVATEARFAEEFGVTLNLADKMAMPGDKSPLETVGALTDYIGSLLNGESDG